MYRFEALVWLHDGDAAWHFVTLPGDVADDIRTRTAGDRRGFGSVPVEVVVGGTTWSTSVFPDKVTGSYVLPVKKSVREAEGLAAGDTVRMELRLPSQGQPPRLATVNEP